MACARATAYAPAPSTASIKALRDAHAYAEALRAVQDALTRDPNDPDLIRLQVLTLSDLGSAERAWEIMRQHPALFPAYQRERIEDDRVARRIRWGEAPARDESRRFDESGAALAELRALQRDQPRQTHWETTRLRVDALSALNHLQRHQQVIDGYQALLRDRIEVPAYILPSVADSMLALRRPHDAEALLKRYLRYQPHDVDAQIQLAYAWIEQERFDLALPLLERLAADQTAWPHRVGVRQGYQNWDKYSADVTLALARAYANDNAEAERSLRALAALGPVNAGLQEALGQVESRRLRPSDALQRYAIALTIDPRERAARLGQVDALATLQRADQATAVMEDLEARYPEDPRVPRARQALDRYLGWQFKVEGGIGRSRGGDGDSASPLGSRDGQVDVQAQTPLIDDRWRIAALGRDDWATFAGERVSYRGGGLGVHYRYDRLGVSLDALHSSDRYDTGTSVILAADWRFSDAWQGTGALAKKDPEASLQARRFGITANSATLGANYTPSETAELTAQWKHLRYDDGNRRDAWSLDGSQRVYTRPHLSVDGLVSAAASHGSDGDAVPYFNPRHDASLAAGVRLDHLGWRRYEREFHQVFEVTVGPYWQQGYGTAWIPTVGYRHRWQPDVGNRIEYGLAWSRPVYDGQRENRVAFDVIWQWGSAP